MVKEEDFNIGLLFKIVCSFIIICIFAFSLRYCSPVTSAEPSPTNAIEYSQQWGGYSPFNIYTVYDKKTGVYYAVTDQGGICPMYTIEGEIKLVDQGNEYVIHKNLGDLNAQE